MGFLWQLLPGAREARNQVIIGYAWLFATVLWLGIPEPAEGTNFKDLADAVGPLGTGVAVSAVAFLVGSVSDDVFGIGLGTRGARAFTYASDVPAHLSISRMSESLRSELERLEASIDRGNAEVLLRAGLIPPILLAAAAGARHGWAYAFAGAISSLLLLWQLRRRLTAQRGNLYASEGLRRGHEKSLEREARELRRQAADLEAEEAEQREQALLAAAEGEIDQRRRDDAELRERENQREALRVELGRLEDLDRAGQLDDDGAEQLAVMRGEEERAEARRRELLQKLEDAKAQVAELHDQRDAAQRDLVAASLWDRLRGRFARG